MMSCRRAGNTDTETEWAATVEAASNAATTVDEQQTVGAAEQDAAAAGADAALLDASGGSPYPQDDQQTGRNLHYLAAELHCAVRHQWRLCEVVCMPVPAFCAFAETGIELVPASHRARSPEQTPAGEQQSQPGLSKLC